MATFNVKAHWDAEARVWWAESDDLLGLAAEAETYDKLTVELRHIIPELLALNMPSVDITSAKYVIVSEQVENVIYA